MIKRSKMKTLLKVVFIVFPLFLGFVGYMPLYEYKVSDSLYAALNLYQLQMISGEINAQIEVARWFAPIASATMILSFISKIREYFWIRFKTKQKKTIAMHGDTFIIDELEKQLDKDSIRSQHSIALSAKKQIIAFESDEENLDFLRNHFTSKSDDKEIYIKLDNAVRDNLTKDNINVFSISEICARTYWDQYPIQSRSKIVIIGSHEVAESILTHGLIQNTFSVDSGVEYHTFGIGEEYFALHHQIHQFAKLNEVNPTGDAIFKHTCPWFEKVDVLHDADRIILADSSSENIRILSSIIEKLIVKEVHVKLDSTLVIETLFGDTHELMARKNGKIAVFGLPKDLYSKDIIINEKLMRRGKFIHATYFRKYQCLKDQDENTGRCSEEITRKQIHTKEMCLNCSVFKKDWRSQSHFIRMSNIAQADHLTVKLSLLGLKNNVTPTSIRKRLSELDSSERERLSEIEHLRWNKYHFMNNWTYNETRDNSKRQHHLLVAYNELSDLDKGKDFDAFTNLPNII